MTRRGSDNRGTPRIAQQARQELKTHIHARSIIAEARSKVVCKSGRPDGESVRDCPKIAVGSIPSLRNREKRIRVVGTIPSMIAHGFQRKVRTDFRFQRLCGTGVVGKESVSAITKNRQIQYQRNLLHHHDDAHIGKLHRQGCVWLVTARL